MSNRGAIRQWAERYLHRSDWSEQDITDAIEATSTELGSRLRAPENAAVFEIDAADWVVPYPLPDGVRAVEAVELLGPGGWRSLQAVGRAFFNSVPTGGDPAFYWINGSALYVAPNRAGTYRLFAWEQPAALGLDPADTNAVLQVYPELYRYRCLGELAMITQDVELAGGYLAQFERRLAAVNRQAANLRLGDAPAIRSI